MMDLPKETETLFWDDVTAFEKENKMPFIDIATRKGMERGYVESILTVWEERFGAVSSELKDELTLLDDIDLYKRIFKASISASSLEAVREIWQPQK